jgi:CRP-like cAMP-binding protein
MATTRLALQQYKSAPQCSATTSDSLTGIAILQELPPDELSSLARRCRWRRYGAGQTILQYCDDSHDVFFVVRGRVGAIYHSASGREVRFSDLQAGDIFGEFGAIDGKPRTARRRRGD